MDGVVHFLPVVAIVVHLPVVAIVVHLPVVAVVLGSLVVVDGAVMNVGEELL
jgi:hypothetical protein